MTTNEKLTIPDESRSKAITSWAMFVITAAVAGVLTWLIRDSIVLDINDPEFNPLSFLILFFLGAAAWYGVHAARSTFHLRRFGVTRLELDEEGLIRSGARFEGVIRTARRLDTRTAFTVTLQRLDGYDFRSSRDGVDRPRRRYVVAWENAVEVPSRGADSSQGMSFAFDIPAFTMPSASRSSGGFQVSSKTLVTIPFMKPKVFAHNTPPDAIAWKMMVSAETAHGPYRAEFTVPCEVDEPSHEGARSRLP